VSRAAVAIVTTYYRPVLGGAEAAAERLATFLERRGHRVVVLTKRTTRTDPARETLDGVAVERLRPIGPRSGFGKWAVLPSIFNALLQRKTTIDLICCVDYRGVGLAALAAGRLTGKPVVFQAQTEGVISGHRVRAWLARVGVDPEGTTAKLATWPIRALYGRADAIGCISHAIEQEALAEGVPRARVHYLPNPVDTRRFAPAGPAERRAIREGLGVRPEAVLCAFVGRLSREKGVMELLGAWERVRPAADLAIIGPPMPGHPWDVSQQARRFVEAHGLSSSVRLVGGQPPEQVARWLRAADFAAQPSHFEAMGLAAAEAMAAGLPVVASDTGGYRDFVVSEHNGLLVPTGDLDALGSAIARLAADADLRGRLAGNARETAGRFDESRVLEAFAVLIDQLAGHD
jgi:glycosyltransferase involved in cell wall biosynthesis